MRYRLTPLLLFPLLLLAAPGFAQTVVDPVKRARIRVDPFYQAARHPDDPPLVNVAPRFDKLLASTKADDILRVRDEIERDPGRVTPMTLMVLALRLYDVGRRDDAVFWYYAAKNRYYLLGSVADMKTPALAPAAEAMNAFNRLAGPIFNGYAFCDVARQREIALRAADWTARHAYEVLLLPQIPARAGDRKENYQKALAELLAQVKRERDYLAVPENVGKLKAARAANDADQKFCWK